MHIDTYSGNIRLRMATSLHRDIAYSAQKEGISINQYCQHVLAKAVYSEQLNSRSLNYKLRDIRKKYNINSLDKMYEEMLKVYDQIISKKDEIKEKAINIKNNTKSNMRDIEELEYKYPVFVEKWQDNTIVKIKIPSMKLIIRPIEDTLPYGLPEKIQKNYENDPSILVTQNNTDNLLFFEELSGKSISKKDLNSVVIYSIDMKLQSTLERLKSVAQELKELEEYKCFTLDIAPTYLISEVGN